MSYRIVLEKENFKFSGSHFTIFGPNEAERLHGHNYYVVVELWLASIDRQLGLAFDFNLIKPMIREITSSLDERILLPKDSPFLRLERVPEGAHEAAPGAQIRAHFAAKTYEFPESDVEILPIPNVTSEELARYIAETLARTFRERAKDTAERVRRLAVGVQETRGQTVYFDLDFDSDFESETELDAK